MAETYASVRAESIEKNSHQQKVDVSRDISVKSQIFGLFKEYHEKLTFY